MKYTVHNYHSKAVMLPGGMLSPGGTVVAQLSEQEAADIKASSFLEIKEARAKKKKAAKKNDADKT